VNLKGGREVILPEFPMHYTREAGGRA